MIFKSSVQSAHITVRRSHMRVRACYGGNDSQLYVSRPAETVTASYAVCKSVSCIGYLYYSLYFICLQQKFS